MSKFVGFHPTKTHPMVPPLDPELPNVGIMVSRIPDISGRKFGHFQTVATNLSIFAIRGNSFMTLATLGGGGGVNQILTPAPAQLAGLVILHFTKSSHSGIFH